MPPPTCTSPTCFLCVFKLVRNHILNILFMAPRIKMIVHFKLTLERIQVSNFAQIFKVSLKFSTLGHTIFVLFDAVLPPRKSPRRATVVASVTHLLRRSSFYSASPSLQSRTAQRCELLEQRMTMAPLRSPVIARIPVDSVANDNTSPRRVKLFSQIL